MTPGAVRQRAARLAPELDRVCKARPVDGDSMLWSIEMVLDALYRAGLTLDADMPGGGQSDVLAAINMRDGAA